MLSNIREDVTRTIAHAQFQMQAPPPLPDLPDFITSHFDPFTASDDTVDIDGGTLGMVTTQLPPMQTARPDAPRSEEHTSELQSLMRTSYAVFCLKKKNNNRQALHSLLRTKLQYRYTRNS